MFCKKSFNLLQDGIAIGLFIFSCISLDETCPKSLTLGDYIFWIAFRLLKSFRMPFLANNFIYDFFMIFL